VSDLHNTLGLVLMIMRYIGSRMKETSNTMAAICTHDTTMVFFGNLFCQR
jgi:hypothetical protein